MGKDKMKRRRDKDDSSDDTSGPSEDEKSRKKHKKEKKDKKKKHKKSKGKDSGDDEMVAKAKAFLKDHLGEKPPKSGSEAATAGATGTTRFLPPTLPDKERITTDDYVLKTNEYKAWLLEDRKVHMYDMPKEEAQDIFKDFVGLWNAGLLPARYYRGEVEAPARTTTHQWKFKGGNDEYKKFKAMEKASIDEMLGPKATGRDAMLERKAARREESKARDASPDRGLIPGGKDMYGGEDTLEAAKAWEGKRAAQRQAARGPTAAMAAAAAREEATMAHLRSLLPQGPILIPKRQPQ